MAHDGQGATVQFYHVSAASPAAVDDVLPPLISKMLDGGHRALVLCPTSGRMMRLDDALWAFRDSSFLPHGCLGMGGEAHQPVLLLPADVNAAATEVQAHSEGRVPVVLAGAETLLDAVLALPVPRVCYVFSASESDMGRARELYKTLKKQNVKLVYWQQTDTGWKKMAEA